MKSSMYMKTIGMFALSVVAVLTAGPALSQAAPFAGTIAISITASTTTPPIGTTFTVDLALDMTTATGTCTTGGGVTPLTYGASSLGILFDTTKLTWNSAALCPAGPPNLAAPTCASISGGINCAQTSIATTNQPQGIVCLARLTFTNNSATPGSPALNMTVTHVGGPRGISSNNVQTPTVCGGPASFSAPGTISDGTGISPITPVSLSGFEVR